MPALGGRKIHGQTESGETIRMAHVVADVAVALDSVSQICDSGATVVFQKDGGFIERPGGHRTPFRRERDTYVRDVWIPTGAEVTGTKRTEQVQGPAFNRPTQS